MLTSKPSATLSIASLSFGHVVAYAQFLEDLFFASLPVFTDAAAQVAIELYFRLASTLFNGRYQSLLVSVPQKAINICVMEWVER
jgi:hypothetical protein